jgi:peptidoglycan/LPS O-acetylase OafA/YrhL
MTSITIGSLVTFSVAALSYYVMERPILRLKKRFTRAAPSNGIQQPPATLRCAEAADS